MIVPGPGEHNGGDVLVNLAHINVGEATASLRIDYAGTKTNEPAHIIVPTGRDAPIAASIFRAKIGDVFTVSMSRDEHATAAPQRDPSQVSFAISMITSSLV